MTDLRQACDRCHDKKLRCSKTPNSLTCGRCIKANAPCIFSPPTRSLRSSITYDDPFHWSPLMAFDQIPNPLTNSPPIADNVETSSSEVSQLAEIMVALDKIHNEFPPPGMHHVPTTQLKDYSERMAAQYDLQSTLEQLLRRTQQLASVYPAVVKLLADKVSSRNAVDGTCDAPDCMHRMRESLQIQQQPPLDTATLHLLLACHLRLLDIIDNLVGHARLCAHVVESLPQDHEPQFDVPEIRIGSFIAPKVSAAAMLVSMMIEFQATLTARSKELIGLVPPEQSPREAQILKLQCEALGERSAATMTDLQVLRNHLQNAGLLG